MKTFIKGLRACLSGLIIAPLAVLAFMAVCPAVSYAATPNTVWTRQMGTPNYRNTSASGYDGANGVAVDGSGNVYAAGFTFGDLDGNTNADSTGYTCDLFVVKYASDGTKQWTKQMGTPYDDRANGIALDGSGNVYVAGVTDGDLDGEKNAAYPDTGPDLFVVKYASNGTKLWTKELGTAGYGDFATSVAVDGSGNVYAAGYTDGDLDGNTSAGGFDAFVVKYDTNGNKQWTKQLGTSDGDEANGVAVDGSGNVYVVGFTYGNLGGVNANPGSFVDGFVAKYDTDGNIIWTRLMGTVSDDYATSVAVDAGGNVYVAGYTDGDLNGNTNAGSFDLFVVKYDTFGNKLHTVQRGTDVADYAFGVAVDAGGNVYVSGETDGGDFDGNVNAGLIDIFVVKFSPAWVWQWTKQMGTGWNDEARDVAVDSTGDNVYAAGYTFGGLDGNTNMDLTGDTPDLFVVKMSHKPTCESVTPSSGTITTGTAQTFIATYSDANWAADIRGVSLMVADNYCCFPAVRVDYDTASGTLSLMDDSGGWTYSWIGPVYGVTLSNSECSVDCAASSVSLMDDKLILTLKITFNSSFTGLKNIYMDASDTLYPPDLEQKGAVTISLPACAAPSSITVPASSATGSYTVSWGASGTPGTIYYELQEATNPAFTANVRFAYSGYATSASITGRTSGTTYYYRVCAMTTGYNPSGWRTGANGCVVGTSSTCATPASLTVPTTSSTGSYTVRWGASATAGVSYSLQEATNSTFTVGLRTAYTGTALTASITGRPTGKTYYYRVQATKTGSTASVWKVAANGCVVGSSTCATPASITVPTTSATGSYTVRWGASTTAGVTYLLQEATNSLFTAGLRTAYTGPALTISITGRTIGVTYYYRVKATKTGATASAWKTGANGCKVGTSTCATPASITVPATSSTGSYTVRWGASATAGVTYVLEEATNSTFTTGKRTAYTGPALTISITGRTHGVTYYYRVKATKTGYTASAWKTAANGCWVQ